MIPQTATPWHSISVNRLVAACIRLFTVLAAIIMTPAFSAQQSCLEEAASWSAPSTTETMISAFGAEIEPGSRARFEGDVRVNGSDRVFSAGRAELDFERNALILENQVVIQDEVLCVEGERAEGQLLSGEGLIQRAAFRQRSGLQGQVETLQLYSDGAISLTNGAVTFCPSPSPPWSLSIESLATNTEQSTLVARRSTLRLKGVPALYIPYIKIPTGQKGSQVSFHRTLPTTVETARPQSFSTTSTFTHNVTQQWRTSHEQPGHAMDGRVKEQRPAS